MGLTSARITLTVDATIENTGNSLAPIKIPFNYTYSLPLAAGTDVNQADRIFVARRTVPSAGTPDTVDFADATFLDPSGAPATMAEIVALIAVNRSTTPGEILSVGGHATAAIATPFGAANDLNKAGPGGAVVLANPAAAAYAVGSTTSDMLQVAVAAGTNVPYDLIAIGRSAA
jgi:hypothetical protein